MSRWKNHIDGFITKVQQPVKLIDMDVLTKARAGLSKRMRNASSAAEKTRLRAIRDEFDFLIENL